MFKLFLILLFALNLYSSEKLKILIPLYSYPTSWFGQISKFEQIKNKNIETYAIINPKNGPSNKIIEEYVDGIDLLKSYGIHVIGYVHTSYGKRDKFQVMEDIYKWSIFYKKNGVEGTFFDETSDKLKDLDYYKELVDYAKSFDFNFNILNPGYTTDKEYINEGFASVVVTYENSYKAWENSLFMESNKKSDKTSLSILLHDLKEEDFGIAIHKLKNSQFSYIYLTEDGKENPWDTFSEYILKYF